MEAGELRSPDNKTGARMVPLSHAAARLLTALPRDPDKVFVGRKPSAHLTDLQRSLAATRRFGAHPRLQLGFASSDPWREPADDREVARAHAGSDGGAIRSLGARFRQGAAFKIADSIGTDILAHDPGPDAT